MDFINILKDIIQEQRPQGGARQPRVAGGAVAGATQGAQAGSQSGSSSRGGTSHNWQSGDKIASALKNPGKCNRYHEWRQRYNGGRGGYHDACDISTKVGTSLFAPHDGTFTKVDDGTCGNGIIIKGKDENGKELHSGFCHLGSREVPSDGKVTKGDYIGVTGGSKGDPGSGRTTGPHLHWTFKVGGRPINPYTYN